MLFSLFEGNFDISISMSFPETINLYFPICPRWHSSLSESSGKIPTAFNGSKDFLFYVCIFTQVFLRLHT